MKLSEITSVEIAEYLRLSINDLTDNEYAQLETLLSVARAYIKSYTGLEDKNMSNDLIGFGDGTETEFYIPYACIVDNSQKIYVDGVQKTETTHYTIDNEAGKITFLSAPTYGTEVTADYSALPSDEFEEFTIVAYILTQDMHDNRTLYIDKNNMNRTVDTILGMHRTNLL